MSEFNLRDIVESPAIVSILAGIGGATVAAYRLMPGANFLEKLTNLACGGAVAIFCAPGAIEAFQIKTMGLVALMSFLIGTFGLCLMVAIFAGIREVKFGEIISGWISRRG